MRQMLGRAVRLGAVVVCAGAFWLLGPTAGAQAIQATKAAQPAAAADAITVSFANECGRIVKVTVTNSSSSSVSYKLGVEDVEPTSFSIAAGATKVHLWPTHHGKRVVVESAGLAAPKSYEQTEPEGCRAPDLDFDGDLSCESIVVLASNTGEVAAQVRITRNGSQVGDLLEVPAEGSANRVVPMAEGDVINLQRQTGDPDPQWVTILDGEFHAEEGCEGLPPVEITDTCTGVHVKTTNTQNTELVLAFGLLPKGQDVTEHPVAAGATFEHDFTVADKAVVAATWQQARVTMTAVKHAVPASCSGGLPKTGTNIWAPAAGGLLLVLAGVGVFALTRRRRRV